ncbi:MAG: HAD-IA family hydrolase [Clostridia bacterium]|nr:HAD-IA family hydrolase [Clostridia bacterium]
MKYQIDAIVFDFDGVIVDSGADIANAVCHTLRAFGKPLLTRGEIISYVGRGAEQLIRSCFKNCNEDMVKEALPVFKRYYLDNCIVDTKLYDNVKATLEFFKDKKMAVFTNKPEDLTHKILVNLGISVYFKVVIGPESVGRMKPDPEGLLRIIDVFGVQPGRTIMVGDTYTDVEVGKRAGTRTCGVTYGLGDTGRLERIGPDVLTDDIGKLPEFIE